MVHSKGEPFERAGKVKVERIIRSESRLGLGWLGLGSGHSSYNCVSDVLELVLLSKAEGEVVSRDGYVVRVFEKTSSEVNIYETSIVSKP